MAVLLLQLVFSVAAFAQRSTIPQDLIDQLNRQSATTPYNPAQPLPSPLDEVRQEQQQQNANGTGFPQGGPLGAFGQRLSPNGLPINPNLAQQQAQPQSQIELDYSRRAGVPLLQYGYDVFRSLVPSRGQLQTGAVADSYRLSIGDELVITLQGQASRSIRTRIDSEGRIVVPDLPPVPAAGRSLGEVRGDLERAVTQTFLNTNVFVSVGTVRQIAVSVLGEANSPGIYRMGGFASTLDALAMAGGIKNTGSLRHIMLVRGNQTTMIDLYGVMSGVGTAPDLGLADGDRITIPPVGPTVAIGGDVVRPGIFELLNDGTVSARVALELAGGPLRPVGNRYVRLSLDAAGQDMTSDVAAPERQTLRAGDILLVRPRGDLPVGSVDLEGHVRVPGVRSLAGAPDVRRLIGSYDAFETDPYLLLGAVETTDPQTRARKMVPIDLDAIMRGERNYLLKDGDTVIVLGMGDVNYLASADVQAVITGHPPPLLTQWIVTQNPRGQPPALFSPEAQARGQNIVPGGQLAELTPAQGQGQGGGAATAGANPLLPTGQGANAPSLQNTNAAVAARDLQAQQSLQICKGLQALATLAATARPGRFANAIYTTTQGQQQQPGAADANIQNLFPCPAIFDKYPDLLPLVVEYASTVEGEVRIPGPYPVMTGTPLSAVVSVAGGLARRADMKRVEITHYGVDGDAGTSQSDRQLVQLSLTDLTRVALSPGDVIRFNPVFTDRDTGPVSLAGEFRRPGTYDIERGERLSQLIARAGGLTEQAYPYGAVFTRESVKVQEREEYKRFTQQIESGLTTALPQLENSDQSQALVLATQQLVGQLQNATPVGRVVVEADPTVLQVKPQLDPIMEPGDSVFMPKRPFYVSVVGEVLNPTSLQFEPGASPSAYIKSAGGFTQSAEEDLVFIVLPNGAAQPVKTSFWNFTPLEVPPGSTIVVPKDLSPFNLSDFLKSATQILSQLAISAASLAVVTGTNTH